MIFTMSQAQNCIYSIIFNCCNYWSINYPFSVPVTELASCHFSKRVNTCTFGLATGDTME